MGKRGRKARERAYKPDPARVHSPDASLVALVKLLARKAAEADYFELLESRNAEETSRD